MIFQVNKINAKPLLAMEQNMILQKIIKKFQDQIIIILKEILILRKLKGLVLD